MRKIFMTLITALMVVSSLSAALAQEMSKKFAIQGGYAQFADMKIKPISADTLEYKSGMPFDMMAADVAGGAGYPKGRQIAEWEIITNYPQYKLKITASPMIHTEKSTHPDEQAYNTELHYIVTFKYSVSYQTTNSSSPESTEPVTFWVSSDPRSQQDNTARNPLPADVGKNTFVGSQDGEIWFMFTPESVTALQDDSLTAPGYWNGQVVMELVTK